MNKQFLQLAKKYYGTTDLTKLSPRQIDKLTGWVTGDNPEKDSHIRGNKYSGNTYNKLKKLY